MRHRNLYQEVKIARKKNEAAFEKLYKIESAKAAELKAVEEKYTVISQAAEQELREKYRELNHVGDEYHKYASFLTHNGILTIVATLLTYIEGEKYIPFISFEASLSHILIKERLSKQYENMNYDTVKKLYKSGDLILLDDNHCSSEVEFYNYIGKPNYQFGKFGYLYEFVNRLIEYRADNKKDNMTLEELYSFLCHFISTHPELALRNKEKRTQMFMESPETDSILIDCKKLEIKFSTNL